VPTTLAAFPRWMAILRRWNRNWVDHGSSAATAMRRPMSRKNVAASSPRAPNVSTASGTKQYWSHNAVYFARLWSSASTATVQVAIDAWCRWLMARVSWTCEVPQEKSQNSQKHPKNFSNYLWINVEYSEPRGSLWSLANSRSET